MKGINKFFYRVDLLKKLVLFVSLPILLACMILPVGYLLFLFLPISILGIVIGLLPLRIPSQDEILKEVSENHKQYRSQVCRSQGIKTEENIISLEGFSAEKAYLCRSVGSQLIYPVCRTMLYYHKEGASTIFLKDTPIMAGALNQVTEKVIALEDTSRPIVVQIQELSSKKKLVTFQFDRETVSIFVRDEFKIKDFIQGMRENVQQIQKNGAEK